MSVNSHTVYVLIALPIVLYEFTNEFRRVLEVGIDKYDGFALCVIQACG